jgi:hypothetical protein
MDLKFMGLLERCDKREDELVMFVCGSSHRSYDSRREEKAEGTGSRQHTAHNNVRISVGLRWAIPGPWQTLQRRTTPHLAVHHHRQGH